MPVHVTKGFSHRRRTGVGRDGCFDLFPLEASGVHQMRTTLKSGVGSSSGGPRGNEVWQGQRTMRRYRCSPPPRRSLAYRLARLAGWVSLGLLIVVSGLAGGLYLWFHQSVAAVQAHSADVK